MEFLREEKKLSERRAASLVGISRRVLRYEKRRLDDEELRAALRKLAFRYRRAGYRMLCRRLCEQGWNVNHKKVWRMYKEEELSLRRKRRKKIPVLQKEGGSNCYC